MRVGDDGPDISKYPETRFLPCRENASSRSRPRSSRSNAGIAIERTSRLPASSGIPLRQSSVCVSRPPDAPALLSGKLAARSEKDPPVLNSHSLSPLIIPQVSPRNRGPRASQRSRRYGIVELRCVTILTHRTQGVFKSGDRKKRRLAIRKHTIYNLLFCPFDNVPILSQVQENKGGVSAFGSRCRTPHRPATTPATQPEADIKRRTNRAGFQPCENSGFLLYHIQAQLDRIFIKHSFYMSLNAPRRQSG